MVDKKVTWLLFKRKFRTIVENSLLLALVLAAALFLFVFVISKEPIVLVIFIILLMPLVFIARKKLLSFKRMKQIGLVDEYFENKNMNSVSISLEEIDALDGLEFEHTVGKILSSNGFTNVRVTKSSGDQGIDVLADMNETRYGFQTKLYSAIVGNKAVQEAIAGRIYYNLDKCVVVTNNYFTASAKDLAAVSGIELWDRATLSELVSQENKNKSITSAETLYTEVKDMVIATQVVSITSIQLHYRIGYEVAASIVDTLEAEGIVSPYRKNGRKVLRK